jgi:hypothetical protein
MVIVGVDCFGLRGIEGWARGRPGEMVSGTENGDGDGSCDGLYLSHGWMLMDSRARDVHLKSTTTDFDMTVRRLAVGSSGLDDR